MGLFGLIRNTKERNASNQNESDSSRLQTIYFKNGHLFRVVGKDKDNWYDADIVVSDGKTYDLRVTTEIWLIPTPSFGIVDSFNEYGATGMLDYVLRMKAGNCFNRNEKELCSALLWKSTQFMFANKYCNWHQKDYERLINWHLQMGMIDEVEKAKKYLAEKGFIIIDKPTKNKGDTERNCGCGSPERKNVTQIMTAADRERAIVDMTTNEHVQTLANFPFTWNQPIRKYIAPQSHPFVYMNITGENVHIVKSELSTMNKVIAADVKKYKSLPFLAIPVNELEFHESSERGYTRFIFTPITLTGKPAKHPVTIFFTTDLLNKKDTSHGEITYDRTGKISKGHVYFWRNGEGYFLYYKTIDSVLTLYKLERSGIG